MGRDPEDLRGAPSGTSTTDGTPPPPTITESRKRPGSRGSGRRPRRPRSRERRPTARLEEVDHGIVGECEAMLACLAAAERVAPTDFTVMIRGDSGTGKEPLARLIRAMSARADGPFLVVNCSEFAETMLESELFGHKRGAFTGAISDRVGLLEAMDGGTIVLDEIGEMSMQSQPKLLRVIENRTIRRLGESRERKVNVRVIASTNRDLEAMEVAGTFRGDLLARLDQYRITLPPLRERGRDAILIARHYLVGKEIDARPARLRREAEQYLLKCEWRRSNVRELLNLLDRVLVDGTTPRITARDLRMAGNAEKMPELPVVIAEAGEEAILQLIRRRGPLTAAAIRTELGMSKTSARRHLVRLQAHGKLVRRAAPRAALWALPTPKAEPGPDTSTLGSRERQALAVLREYGPVTRLQLEHALDLAERTALRTLKNLMALGLVEKVGQGKGVVYRERG